MTWAAFFFGEAVAASCVAIWTLRAWKNEANVRRIWREKAAEARMTALALSGENASQRAVIAHLTTKLSAGGKAKAAKAKALIASKTAELRAGANPTHSKVLEDA